MKRLRLILSVAALASTPGFAGAVETVPPTASAAVPMQCSGKDMLAEMAATDPAMHQRVVDEASKLENTEAILWKVEKAGVEPSYLFGTIHISDTRVTKLPEKAKAAFDQAKTVALEVVGTSQAAVAEAMGKSPQLMAYTDGQTLDAQITPEEFAKVQGLVSKAGMPGEAAKVLKPWLINMLLSFSDCQKQQMAAGIEALDTQLEKAAIARGATVVGLETAQGQLEAMASVPNDQQIQLLKSGLVYADRTDDMIETLVQMYLKRNTGATMAFQKALNEKTGQPPSALEGFTKILLVDRNATMRDAAKPLFDKGNAFVAVGALHLSGKTGLVALLRDAGFTVTAVE